MKEIPKRYLIKHFDSNSECEEFLNTVQSEYRPIALADTDSYVTVLVERICVEPAGQSGSKEAS